MLAWDAACQDYSRRKLTFHGDRLAALSGLARHFGSRCQDDTYIAGMWLSQLPRSLFWNVPRRGRPDARSLLTETSAPSWSWMSCAGPVETSTADDSFYIADVANILVDYEHKTADQYGDMARASLHFYGFLRCITSVMEQITNEPDGDAYTQLAQLDTSKKYRHLYVDGDLTHDIGYGPNGAQEFGELPDWFHGFEPVEYHCLFLAVSQDHPQDDRALRGLLLEPVGGEQGTFRRVGHIFFRGRCALKMRSRLRPGEPGEHETGKHAALWKRLWECVGPFWEGAEEVAREAKGPIALDIQTEPPWSLYEFDGEGGEEFGFLKLEPRVVTVI